jgi:hypothetical protein
MEKHTEKYIIQKAQKIVSAIYLITDLIKDNDAIKWEVREEALVFISDIMMLDTVIPIEREHALRSISRSSNKIISLLNISKFSSVLSNMNVDIVVNEIKLLIEFIHRPDAVDIHREGYILSDTFFSTDTQPSQTDMNVVSHKGHSEVIRHQNIPKSKGVIVKDKKDSRKNNIISLLKKDSNLTIKDFVKVIKDCSEKTIQRELIDLVEKGVVKREGERRWSTYSLA